MRVLSRRSVSVFGIAVVVYILLVRLTAEPETEWNVASPNKRVVVRVRHHESGSLYWSATLDGHPAIEESILGFERSDVSFGKSLLFERDLGQATVEQSYKTSSGKRLKHHYRAHERRLVFRTAVGSAALTLVLRAHDDGAAVRYETADTPEEVEFLRELTGFALPARSTAWLQPMESPVEFSPAYEQPYSEYALDSDSLASASNNNGWAFPALFKTEAGVFVLLHESDVTEHFCGSHLAPAAGRFFRLALPLAGEGGGLGSFRPRGKRWVFPWRVRDVFVVTFFSLFHLERIDCDAGFFCCRADELRSGAGSGSLRSCPRLEVGAAGPGHLVVVERERQPAPPGQTHRLHRRGARAGVRAKRKKNTFR